MQSIVVFWAFATIIGLTLQTIAICISFIAEETSLIDADPRLLITIAIALTAFVLIAVPAALIPQMAYFLIGLVITLLAGILLILHV